MLRQQTKRVINSTPRKIRKEPILQEPALPELEVKVEEKQEVLNQLQKNKIKTKFTRTQEN